MDCDVAIIGGGPAGSTLGSLLKKYNPQLNVAIFERETFPREHVGESLLPPISRILEEMGCWDKVEAANFPIKVGATFRWGKQPELWNFEFLPAEQFVEEPRPAKYVGQRTRTAFQVDRSVYDTVLLDHAAELGCDVRQGLKVSAVKTDDDAVTGLELESGETVNARYYVDASGNSGILRRALGIGCQYPSTLRNIAIYDYWQNAEWAFKIGVGGTFISVLSVGYGWLWFIPIGPTRTSIGLVVPAEYYKKCGKNIDELYLQALGEEGIVRDRIKNATRENKLTTTRDWSFLAERQAGQNWFLIGECAGFADPILSAGVTMAHIAAQQCAYTILELDRNKLDANWLKHEFQARQTQRIKTHIRFGDYWYTANEQFKELKEFTLTLAQDIGLEMSPEAAWAWLASGGFIDEELSYGAGGYSLGAIKAMSDHLGSVRTESPFETNNVFKLDMTGASWKERADYAQGRVKQSQSYVRGSSVLPVDGHFDVVLGLLQRTSDITDLIGVLTSSLEAQVLDVASREEMLHRAVQVIEALVADGWVKCSYNPNRPLWTPTVKERTVRWNQEPLTLTP